MTSHEMKEIQHGGVKRMRSRECVPVLCLPQWRKSIFQRGMSRTWLLFELSWLGGTNYSSVRKVIRLRYVN